MIRAAAHLSDTMFNEKIVMKPTRRQLERRVVRAAVNWYRQLDRIWKGQPEPVLMTRQSRSLYRACAALRRKGAA